MWEAIRSNKRRSFILLILMGVLLVVLGFVIGMVVDPQYGGAIGCLVALAIWFFLYLIALFQGDNIILLSSGAKKIQKEDAPQLWNIVEEMTIASGLSKMPDIYIINESTPNAFAAGRKPEKAVVAVTSGLLKRLNRDELQGVIAHEIGHIKNLDIRFMTLAAVLMGSIIILSDTFLRSLWYGAAFGGRTRSKKKEGGQEQIIILAVAIVLAILAPILAQMLYFACSRKREYLADATSACYTRYPEGLASALERISSKASDTKKTNRALAPMYIINPLQSRKAFSLFSTHPATEKRVKILRSMSGAGFAAYEAAFKQVEGEKSHCLGSKTLTSAEQVEIRKPQKKADKKKEAVERLQQVNDLFMHFEDFIFIPCACGVRIRIPEGFKHDAIPCPRCGNMHPIPAAGSEHSKDTKESQNESKPFVYHRKTDGWETFKCPCGKVIQLSPKFSDSHIECSQCKRNIKVKNAKSLAE